MDGCIADDDDDDDDDNNNNNNNDDHAYFIHVYFALPTNCSAYYWCFV